MNQKLKSTCVLSMLENLILAFSKDIFMQTSDYNIEYAILNNDYKGIIDVDIKIIDKNNVIYVLDNMFQDGIVNYGRINIVIYIFQHLLDGNNNTEIIDLANNYYIKNLKHLLE